MLNLDFCKKLNDFLGIVPASISSFYRTVERNQAVGGSSNSAHLHGVAADLILDTGVNIESAIWHAKDLKFHGIEYDSRNRHLHLDDHPSGRIWHVIIKPDGMQLSIDRWKSEQV